MDFSESIEQQMIDIRDQIASRFPGIDLAHVCHSCQNAVTVRPHGDGNWDCGTPREDDLSAERTKFRLIQSGSEFLKILSDLETRADSGEAARCRERNTDLENQIGTLQEILRDYRIRQEADKRELERSQTECERSQGEARELIKTKDENAETIRRLRHELEQFQKQNDELKGCLAFTYKWATGEETDDGLNGYYRAHELDIRELINEMYHPSETGSVDGHGDADAENRRRASVTTSREGDRSPVPSGAPTPPPPPENADGSSSTPRTRGRDDTPRHPRRNEDARRDGDTSRREEDARRDDDASRRNDDPPRRDGEASRREDDAPRRRREDGTSRRGPDSPGTRRDPVETSEEGGRRGAEVTIDSKAVSSALKLITCQFTKTDDATGHLRKEQVILQDIQLYFDSANNPTKIAIIVSHCDSSIRDVSTPLRESTHMTVNEFLENFRTRRFPNFKSLMLDYYRSIRQSRTESVMDFLQQFRYVLRVLDKSPDDYVEDFVSKLNNKDIRWDIDKFFYGNEETTLAMIAKHADGLERVYAKRYVKKLGRLPDGEEDETDEARSDDGDDVNASVCQATRQGGKPQDRRGPKSEGPRASKRPTVDHSQLQAYQREMGISDRACYHCGQGGHPFPDFKNKSSKSPCKDKPCVFCGKKNHLSLLCRSKPTTKADFDKAMKPSA